MQTLVIPTPPDFRYGPTVGSHGWANLLPFRFDESTQALYRMQRLSDGTAVSIVVRGETAGGLHVDVEGAVLGASQTAEVEQMIARCLDFEHDLSPFHALVGKIPGYDWIAHIKAGRMLVSPTVWEDLAKTLLTTNTTWAMTIGMVSRLVTLGEPAGEAYTFPAPEQIAALSPDALNAHVRAGYRGAYLHGLALEIAEGRLDPERWRDPSLSSEDIYRQLKSIKGYGDYAAGAMMRLLRRFDQLGLDSVCRAMFKTRYNQGQPATDREIAAYYARFGEWGGLAVWMDVMQDYLAPPG